MPLKASVEITSSWENIFCDGEFTVKTKNDSKLLTSKNPEAFGRLRGRIVVEVNGMTCPYIVHMGGLFIQYDGARGGFEQ
jgi:hypothetical protein